MSLEGNTLECEYVKAAYTHIIILPSAPIRETDREAEYRRIGRILGKLKPVISNDQTTQIQLAVEAKDHGTLRTLVEPHSPAALTELQLFANHTLLMYTCERGTIKLLDILLEMGVETHELEWSDNNELKSVLRNESHRSEMLTKVLDMIPSDQLSDMISTTWDPDPEGQDNLQSPLEMAEKFSDPDCLNALRARLA